MKWRPKLIHIILYTLVVIILITAATFGISNRIKASELSYPLGDTVQVVQSLFSEHPEKTVYGYLPYWSLSNAKYIQFDKITDLAYFGLTINKDGSILKITENGETEPGYNNWVNSKDLKETIKKAKIWKVKIALTIVLQKDEDIDSFLLCDACWENFVEQVDAELKRYAIKDLNLDFEHLTETTPLIRSRYSEFVKFVNTSFDTKYGDSKVIVAAFADSFRRSRITDPVELAKNSDGIFIMAYDFNLPTSEYAGPVAPLKESIGAKEFDVRKAVFQYKEKISPNKLILGVPYYGANFLISEEDKNAKRVPGNDILGYSVSQHYSMIVNNDNIPISEAKWDSENNTPYVIYRNKDTGQLRVLHYENAESLRKKYEFAKEQKLLGVGMWALGFDGNNNELWNVLKDEFK